MWQMSNLEHDGLTTNGIAFMRPTGTFESGVCPGEWHEVTVMGNVRRLRAQRSSRSPGMPVSVQQVVCVYFIISNPCVYYINLFFKV